MGENTVPKVGTISTRTSDVARSESRDAGTTPSGTAASDVRRALFSDGSGLNGTEAQRALSVPGQPWNTAMLRAPSERVGVADQRSAATRRAVAAALRRLDRYGTGAIQWAGPRVTNHDRLRIVRGIRQILANGNAESALIAVEIVMSGMVVDVREQKDMGGVSGRAGIHRKREFANAIGRGVPERDYLKYCQIVISRKELDNPGSVEGNLIHETLHNLIKARVAYSVSLGKPKLLENETAAGAERRCKETVARYLRDRKGSRASYGAVIKHLDQSGTRVNHAWINKIVAKMKGDVLSYIRDLRRKHADRKAVRVRLTAAGD